MSTLRRIGRFASIAINCAKLINLKYGSLINSKYIRKVVECLFEITKRYTT
jgi:hypothetical protein